ncbi:MAG: hypothetical protein LQ344_008096 [Seirophora lacunosa]|nr:MAG: hypothetical protein LQ344_008096 [Seirophora lacunosa]
MAQNDTQRQQQMDAWLAGPVSKPPPGVSSDFVNVHCHDQRTVRIASAAVNGISDVAILVIPISVVWRLQMQRKKKLRAIAVLASGLL